MTRICNFPISETKRCKQPVANGRPNCGRHRHNLSANQLGQHPTAYRKGGELHVWAGEPDDFYCLIHGDPAHQVLYQVSGEIQPCRIKDEVRYTDEHGELHRDDGPAVMWPNGTQEWYQHGQLHRDDGPTWIFSDGTQVWHWRGERVTEEEHAELRKQSRGV